MATKTLYVTLDHSVMSGYDSGNSVDQHHPVGTNGTYTWRPLVKFDLNWDSVVQITSAVLHVRSSATTSPATHVSFGATPKFNMSLITSSWSGTQGGSAENLWSSSASPKSSTQPTSDTGNAITWTVGSTARATWFSKDITAFFDRWAPTSVLKSTGGAGGNETNYGIKFISFNEGSTTNTWEFNSANSSYAPYIVLTYTTNQAPNAPTSMTPTGGAIVGTTTPTIAFTHSDPDGDALATYDLQVSTDSSFTSVTHWTVNNSTTGISGNNVSRTYAGTALTRGTTYYWRARTNDGTVDGAWSAAQSFKVNSLPTVSLTDPASSGIYAHMVYTSGSGWGSARLYFSWSFSDAQGQTQTNYEWEVYDDNAGSPGASFATGSGTTAKSVTVSTTVTRGNKYHIRVRAKDGLEWSNWTSYRKVTCQWGYASFTKDVRIGGNPPTTWDVTSLSTTVGASQSIVMEYNSGSNGTGTGLVSPWKSSLAAVPKNNFVYYRVWFLSWGSASPGSPTFNSITIRNTAYVAQPDFWYPTPLSGQQASIELSDRAFGTQSLRIDGDGTGNYVTQQVKVEQDSWYVLQARIRSIGNSGAVVYLAESQNTAYSSSLPKTNVPLAADSDWAIYTSDPWFSGSATFIWVHCRMNGAAETYALFDGLKMEKGTVGSSWTPSLIGQAAVIDAGGVMVDATTGTDGVFRLKGSSGGSRDIVALGANGLTFGGDATLYSGSANILQTGATFDAVAGSGVGYRLAGRQAWLPSRVEGFCVDNPTADTGVTAMTRFVATNSTSAYVARPVAGRTGRVVGLAYRMSTAITNGTMTLYGVTGGTEDGGHALTSASATSGYIAFGTPLAFSAGTSIGVGWSTDASYAPTTNDWTVDVLVEYEPLP